MRDLTDRQRTWAQLVAEGTDERAAATSAGYSSPDDAAWRLRKHPRVQALVAELRGTATAPATANAPQVTGGHAGIMTSDEVLAGISDIARDDSHRPSRLKALEWLAGYHRLRNAAALELERRRGAYDMDLATARKIRKLVRESTQA
jgi:hypothetical protein